MYIVEWTDREGNLHQREFETLENAQVEQARLEEEYDHVAIIWETDI